MNGDRDEGRGTRDASSPPPFLVPRPESVGLCFTCRWTRLVTSRRGSTFYRCARAEVDPRFVRYPQLPKLACAGYEERLDT